MLYGRLRRDTSLIVFKEWYIISFSTTTNSSLGQSTHRLEHWNLFSKHKKTWFCRKRYGINQIYGKRRLRRSLKKERHWRSFQSFFWSLSFGRKELKRGNTDPCLRFPVRWILTMCIYTIQKIASQICPILEFQEEIVSVSRNRIIRMWTTNKTREKASVLSEVDANAPPSLCTRQSRHICVVHIQGKR